MAKKESLLVTFDLESTGKFVKTDEILQIAAMPMGDSDLPSFNRFILPTVPIHWRASQTHGITVVNGCLERNGEDLDADEDAGAVLKQFFKWCADMHDEKNLVLVAHNGSRFDFHLLFNMARKLKVGLPTKLENLRLVDSRTACQKLFKEEFGGCGLETLKGHLVEDGGSQSHDALDDCDDLKEVLVALASKNGLNVEEMLRSSGAVKKVDHYKVLWEE